MKNAVRVSLASRIGASVEKKLKKPDRFFVYGVANLPFFSGQVSQALSEALRCLEKV